ncbi:MAG: exodeoxyribonuclease III [Nocardioidaceae bacterium]|nr:exodeoxyribonuclease III [Nocardioidaceae bacterium]
MRVATWNINSVRSRIDRVVAWIERSDVDVVALQETKSRDEQFPYDRFADLGYEVAHHGHSQWNGVAIASRVGLADVTTGFPGQPLWGEPLADEARALGATCGGVRFWSVYVPHGREVGDPHYAYKLDWLSCLRDAGQAWLETDADRQIALMGDWNIAPRDDDVWDMAAFDGATHVSQPERDAFAAFEPTGFTDVVRRYAPGPGVYTYWDYQRLCFAKKRGMRLDFVLASPALAARVTGALIDREERKGNRPSDHVPVVVELA